MKNFFILCMFCLLLGTHSPDVPEFTLAEAADKGLVTYNIAVNPESTHYLDPFIIHIRNTSDQELKIKVPNGLTLLAPDSAYQDFIITKEALLALAPQAKKSSMLFAMCTERSDRAPTEELVYKAGATAGENLKVLSEYIESHELYSTLGQNAMWAMAGSTGLEEIVGFDTVNAAKLVRLVANRLGIEDLPGIPAVDDFMHNYYCSHFKVWMGGEFKYKLSKQRSISIAMFDKNNIVVRELYNNPAVPAGVHTFNYEFDASCFTDDYYYIRMIEDNRIVLEGKIDIPKKNDTGR